MFLARCPSCALGQGQGGSDSLVVVAALVLLPVAVGLVTGLLIGRMLKRLRD